MVSGLRIHRRHRRGPAGSFQTAEIRKRFFSNSTNAVFCKKNDLPEVAELLKQWREDCGLRIEGRTLHIITEKSMTSMAEKRQRIVDAVKRTGYTVRVTFNYRYSPVRT